MTAPTRPPGPIEPDPTPTDPDGGVGGIHELLSVAVEEAARLLDADGAMVYLIDPATGNLQVRARRRHPQRTQPRLGPRPGAGARDRDVRASAGRARRRRHERLPERPLVPPRHPDRPRRRGHRHPLDGRRAARCRRPDVRGDGHVLHARRRVRQGADRPRSRAGRPRRRRHGQHPAPRGARPIARRARPPGRSGTGPARDRRRITALRDPAEILQQVVELASRLVGGRGRSSTSWSPAPTSCAGRSTTACGGSSATRSGRSCGSRSGRAPPGWPSPRTGWSSRATTWWRSSRPARIDRSSTTAPASAR